MPQPAPRRHPSVLMLALACALASSACALEQPRDWKGDAGVAVPGDDAGPTGSGGSGGAPNPGGGSGGGPAQEPVVDAAPSAPDVGPGADAGAPDSGPPTYSALIKTVLAPGCSAPNGACHSVLRHNYFLFAEDQAMRSHMLLVPTAAKVGTIPARVMSLLDHVIPSKANDPNSVAMPPQSGQRLGNPPVRKPPLTAEQVAAIKAWATSGAAF